MLQTYSWDEAKRLSNLERHGLDFVDAWRVFEVDVKVTLESARDGELRFMDIAYVEKRLLSLVYTIRNNDIRIISFRKSRHPKETRIYEAAI